MTKKDRAAKIYGVLRREYKDACCTLLFDSPQQFLFANILSAQCTDDVASRVSIALMKKFGGAEGIAKASLSSISEVIRPAGFYNVKSRYIKKTAKLLVDEFNGELPNNLDDLKKFSGIARKTGLVILGEVFNKVEGIVIDTHNIRLAKRLGLTKHESAEKIEKDLMKLLPRTKWRMWSHLMVFHGRKICIARSPKCQECLICEYCDFGCINNKCLTS
ncbi:endonuclease III [Candidatus Dojkabacteria bacterium]|nr:endonuclease III [Candidatus Dojkabacteria bacterium]